MASTAVVVAPTIAASQLSLLGHLSVPFLLVELLALLGEYSPVTLVCSESVDNMLG